jgi:signal peptidase I
MATDSSPVNEANLPSIEGIGSTPKPSPAKPSTMLEPPKDVLREIKETIVFVVVLVLLLKLFVAEAFVIPTGSMAETLWGDQVNIVCSSCSHRLQLSASLKDGRRENETEWNYLCPNCGYQGVVDKPNNWSSGDRVLVSKYEFHFRSPQRFDVPVFKFPERPFDAYELTTMNYIKRLIGLSDETIGVYAGDLYVARGIDYSDQPKPDNLLNAWQREYLYRDAYAATSAFEQGKFQIVRKSPDQILAVMRPVFNLEKQPLNLTGQKKSRWFPSQNEGDGWKMLPAGFVHEGKAESWVRYQHIQPGWKTANDPLNPTFIDDFLAYNLGDSNHWVPDLCLECTVDFLASEATATLELSKGKDRFQAVFSNQQCTLKRITTENGIEKPPVEIASKPVKLTTPGKYALRFANFDSRLTVWIDGKVIDFGNKPNSEELATDYEPPDRKRFMPSDDDIQRPARVGATGSVECSKVRLFRDLYYVKESQRSIRRIDSFSRRTETDRGSEPELQTFYVQPGHYLCFGDNSSASSDSRSWGVVPERLLLGRAVVIYWPYDRWRVIE